ncbi:UL7 [Meleagrid alphaherpesvirus 1]|uniref:UL7 n=1 Tax=Meleagrid herpesvirus 1 TaxID=37108 RepID=Q9DPS7_MEHV1|nr:tegument protein UL7 [Meleagrid alphaherpesvirus 1]AKQ48626.1 tegument protein UL7 [iBAC vector pMeHV1-C7]AKQ48698.1 tegument protein UL7 [iBAC vector pMeHV1-C9]AKQ48770.1 tegument protein UL7 [iBAC vector pMeHV1-C10]AKQ48842.1 tegument protein UL7 [iBAC vector pMeHV1-C17]AKQ48915.1 tegument protein UL7 [iBAC vector pMeHV1-C18]
MEDETNIVPHPLDSSCTLDALIIDALREGEGQEAIIEELIRQPMARMMMEIREIRGVSTRFTGISVNKLRVDQGSKRLCLTLAGADAGSEIDSHVYYQQCMTNTAFKGFVFIVLTAAEDIVKSIGVPPSLLKFRLALFRPRDHLDFALCLLVAFLENRVGDASDVSLYVQIQSFLKYAWTRVTSINKMRRFLCVTITWLLNTSMELGSICPFDRGYVLPHYSIYKHLNGTWSMCANVIRAIYLQDVPSTMSQAQSALRGRDSIVLKNEGLLNGAFQKDWIGDVIYDWWKCDGDKLWGEEGLFGTYVGKGDNK